jgi:hypothetical protein
MLFRADVCKRPISFIWQGRNNVDTKSVFTLEYSLPKFSYMPLKEIIEKERKIINYHFPCPTTTEHNRMIIRGEVCQE